MLQKQRFVLSLYHAKLLNCDYRIARFAPFGKRKTDFFCVLTADRPFPIGFRCICTKDKRKPPLHGGGQAHLHTTSQALRASSPCRGAFGKEGKYVAPPSGGRYYGFRKSTSSGTTSMSCIPTHATPSSSRRATASMPKAPRGRSTSISPAASASTAWATAI